jgi:hypothetical protein
VTRTLESVTVADADRALTADRGVDYLEVNRPCRVPNPGAASGVGKGMGVALGTKLAKPIPSSSAPRATSRARTKSTDHA